MIPCLILEKAVISMFEILLITAMLTFIGYLNYKSIIKRSKNLMELFTNHNNYKAI